jgi:methylated-DNA-[protein]-cysteine S-methyltransferase
MREIFSPIGMLRLVASKCGLRAIDLVENTATLSTFVLSNILDEAELQLTEYFEGRRVEFDIPLDPVGTEFQKSAWRVLSTIPYGTTISYAEQARALGDVRKARAVGGANGRNPIPIVVPCHRVIGSDGSLTGFAVGLEIKKFLIDHEHRHVST